MVMIWNAEQLLPFLLLGMSAIDQFYNMSNLLPFYGKPSLVLLFDIHGPDFTDKKSFERGIF